MTIAGGFLAAGVLVMMFLLNQGGYFDNFPIAIPGLILVVTVAMIRFMMFIPLQVFLVVLFLTDLIYFKGLYQLWWGFIPSLFLHSLSMGRRIAHRRETLGDELPLEWRRLFVLEVKSLKAIYTLFSIIVVAFFYFQ